MAKQLLQQMTSLVTAAKKQVAAKKIAPKRAAPVKETVHGWLHDHGFKPDGEPKVEKSTSRYTKRGFYDGDFPNAHQSLKTAVTHSFNKAGVEKDLTGDMQTLHKHLQKHGFSSSIYKWGSPSQRRQSLKAVKGSHIISGSMKLGLKRSKLTVNHHYSTSKPDLEFERSGRGRGQVI